MRDDLRVGTYKGIVLAFRDIEDSGKKSLALYSYPYRNAPDVEDLGSSSTVKLTVFFLNDRYEEHKEFINRLRENGPGELVHPAYGSVTAIPTDWAVTHDDRIRTAEVRVTFQVVEEAPVLTSAPTLTSKSWDMGSVSSMAAVETMAALGKDLETEGINGDVSAEGIGEPGYLSGIFGLATSARNGLAVVHDTVGTARKFVNGSVKPLGMLGESSVGSLGVTGALVGTIADAINSVAGVKSSLLSMPGRFMRGMGNGFGELDSAFGSFSGSDSLRVSYRVSRARAKVAAASVELRADESAEKGVPLSLREYGQPYGEVRRGRIMTMAEVDQVVTDARRSVNDALADIHLTYGDSGHELAVMLKSLAASLQEMADDIRLRRPMLVDYQVPAKTSLHLVCFALYSDISRADEILRLNAIKDPNFIPAGRVLKVYAA
jgi:prophage DNA circulation protein